MAVAQKDHNGSYEAKDIQVLEGLEAVRRRPGMYVGGTDIKALHHLVYEVVDNAIDEALAGACDRIEIRIFPDSRVSCDDNGRGIPVGIQPTMKKSALEVVMTTLHAGGKFGGGGYKVSGGLHGVGVSAVNALSEWCEVEVRREGQIHFQRYERGRPLAPVKAVAKMSKGSQTGTKVTFKFDKQIFKEDIDFRFDTLAQRFREMAFVTRGVTMHFVDERANHEVTFYFEGGITSFVRYLNRNRETLHPVAKSNYVEEPGDAQLTAFVSRRSTLEIVIRRYVEALPRVEVISNCEADRLVFEPNHEPLTAIGVVARRNHSETIELRGPVARGFVGIE